MEASKEIIRTNKDDIWLDDNNIARIKVQPNFEFDENELKRHFDAYTQLGIGIKNKTYLIVDTSAKGKYIVTPEGRNESANRSKDYFIAIAIIGNSILTLTLVNALGMFYNYTIPLRIFSTEKAALAWIEELKSKEIQIQQKNTKESIMN